MHYIDIPILRLEESVPSFFIFTRIHINLVCIFFIPIFFPRNKNGKSECLNELVHFDVVNKNENWNFVFEEVLWARGCDKMLTAFCSYLLTHNSNFFDRKECESWEVPLLIWQHSPFFKHDKTSSIYKFSPALVHEIWWVSSSQPRAFKTSRKFYLKIRTRGVM